MLSLFSRQRLVATAALLISSSLASAQTVQMVSTIDGSQQNVITNASGSGTFVVDTALNTVSYTILYSNLGSAETGSHIHGPAAPGNNGNLLHGLPFGSPAIGVWNYSENQEADILGGMMYVNIHTQNHAPGEIRGQIVPAPVSYCTCTPALAVCGNGTPVGGCVNSTGSGAIIQSEGLSSVAIDTLVLVATNLPVNQSGIFYMGQNAPLIPFGDGLRCVGGATFRYPITNSGSTGELRVGPGIAAHSVANFGLSGHIQAGANWNFQCWYRDPTGPCGNAFSLSDAVTVTWTP